MLYYKHMQKRNRPFDFIRLLDPKPERAVWYENIQGYKLFTSTGYRFAGVRYNTREPHKGKFAVYALKYDELSDPEGRFRFDTGTEGYLYWVSLEDKPAVEYALAVLRASSNLIADKRSKSEKETLPVLIRLRGDIPGLGPHGIVHIVAVKCRYSRNPSSSPRKEWGEAENVHAADEEYPEHELFWCTTCFGFGNPRRFDRLKHGRPAYG